MPTGERQLRLVVPLFADTDASLIPLLASEFGTRRFPYIETFLSRADHVALPAHSIDTLLCSLFGVDTCKAVPYAALSWLADTGCPMPTGTLRADPVQLQADMEHVLLMDSSQFLISDEETAELVSSMNTFLAEEGWVVDAPHPRRWYIKGVTGSAEYSALHEVRGENILPHMPRGELAARWRKVLNEIQMLLHVHPVNQGREQRGEYTINGIWPWGGGDINLLTETDLTCCYGDSIILKGLSLATGVEYSTQASMALDDPAPDILVLLPVLHEPTVQALAEYIKNIEENWLGPILGMLKRGELDCCQLFLGETDCFTLTRQARGRWWRRKKLLFRQINAD